MVAALGAGVLAAGLIVAAPGAAGASSGPFTPSVVTTTSVTDMICRAYGGTLSANSEADQQLSFTITSPNAVRPGDTFSIKIKQPFSAFPAADNSTGIAATIVAVYNEITRWKLPAGLQINSVSLAPIDGNLGANADAGYYVAPADVPKVSGNPDPSFDPLTLPAAKRIAIPGTAPVAYVDSSTNIVRMAMLGTGNESSGTVYPGGSIVQPPALTINVTAKTSVAAGTDLGIKVAGSLPGSNFTGGQPGNFPAPNTITVNQANATSSDTTWTDPSYVNYVYTTALGGLIKIVAKAACAPGYESNTDLGTSPPDYYTGPNALPNGTAPLLNHTVVTGIGVPGPFDGASYITGTTVSVSYGCVANNNGEPYDTCDGDLPNGALIDTSTSGSYTFTVNATDSYQDPLTRTIHYSVADPVPPVANAGAPQTGKTAGTVVTLDGSGTTDPNGPPALPLTYTWAQTSGPSVTLSDIHAIKPTFTVAPADNPSGNTYGFSLTVNNPYLSNTATTTVTSAASTPTVTVAKTRPGGGTTFYEGDVVTLGATITNPDGTNPGDYTYAWSFNSGISTTLSSSTAANPTFVLPPNGTAACASGAGATNCPTFKVIVTKTNTGKASASAALTAYGSSLPTTPVANAGANKNAPNPGGVVTLDGSASTQAQGHALSYQWTQVANAAPAVTLSDPTAQKPTFVMPPGTSTTTTYTFSLVVKDTQNVLTSGANTNTSTAVTTNVFQVPNRVVAAATGSPASTTAGTTVTLDGTASTEPNLAPLTYTWTQVANGAPAATLSDIHAAKPTFAAPPATTPGGYTAQFNLSVTNGGPNPGDSDATVTPVSIVVAASTPTVAAPTKVRDGGGTTFSTGDKITLSVGITNPDGTAEGDYSYAWVLSTGIPTTLTGANTAHPTYILPPASQTAACASGTGSTNCPTFKVTVTKINTNKSSAQSAALANYASTLANRPTASAGSAQGVKVGSSVTLDGSGSGQAQGHPLTYTWSQTSGPAVTLSDTHAVKPTFTAPTRATSLGFSLTVVDGQNAVTGTGTNGNTSTASSTTVTVTTYTAPAVSAGSDQSLLVDSPVTLQGSASQADGHTLTIQWAQTAGTPVSLSDPTALQPTFAAPTLGPVDLSFLLTVVDTQNPDPTSNTRTASVTVHVTNTAPVADAGSGQSVLVESPVTLDGSGSHDVDGHALTYTWTQLSGAPVTLSNVHAVQPTFTSPSVLGALVFQLTVDDGHGLNDSATVSVGVGIVPAVANAGNDQYGVKPNTTVTLDGSGSSDPNPGGVLTYTWTQIAGPPVSLSDAHAAKPTFSAPVGPTTVSFELDVEDQYGATGSGYVNVDVTGIPGYDLKMALRGTLRGERDSSSFIATVTNAETGSRDVSQNDVHVSVDVNGQPVSASKLSVGAKSATLAADRSVNFIVQWAHGDTLHAGDVIKITVCVRKFGDEHPGNDCATLAYPSHPINLAAGIAPLVVGRTAPSHFHVGVLNLGPDTVTPVRTTDLTVTVQVGESTPQTLASSKPRAALNPGNIKLFGYTWTHAALPKGTVVTVNACLDVPGNVSLASCSSSTTTVR
ncbi:MAG TPA: PKD domain-containing protein [Acidimicrobiia bacterium]|nr:PKD domain-containing protein [Acidimicrobiia bacterium]